MRVLHVIHDFLPRHRAGSEIYADELSRQLIALGHEVYLLCAEYDPTRPHASLSWRFWHELPVIELVNNWACSSFRESYSSPLIERQLEHVLLAVQPDVLHIHNLLNLSFQLPAIATRLGIPCAATLHEYVLVCPSGGQRVHLDEQHVCFEIDGQRCVRCFSGSAFAVQMAFSRVGGVSPATSGRRLITRVAGLARRWLPRLFARAGRSLAQLSVAAQVTEADIAGRLSAAREVFQEIELFVAPSAALAADFERFGLSPDKLVVSDYGFAPLSEPPSSLRPRPRPDSRLRIGFVGTLTWHKGVHLLIEAVSKLPAERYQVLIHGSLDTFPDYVAGLRERAAGLPVTLCGGFDRDQVAAVYAQLDVLVVASLWPENSPLVIHEAFMAGVPVIGSRIGGTADLIRDGDNGLLYDPGSAEALAAALQRLIDDPELLVRWRERLPVVKPIAEDALEWQQRYQDLCTRRHRRPGSGPGDGKR